MPITPNGGPNDGAEDGDDRTRLENENVDQVDTDRAEQEPDDDAQDAVDEPDAEGQDDEGGEDEADGQDADLATTGDQRGKPNATIRELRARAQRAEQERDERDRRVRELEGTTSREEQAEARRREEALLSQMTPDERALYRTDQRTANVEQELRRTQLMVRDSADSSAYSAKAAADPRYRNFASKVEAKVAEMRQRGAWAPRDVILATLIGQEILAKGAQAGKALKRGAQQRVENGRAAAPNTRADSSRRGRREPSLEERLANVRL